MNNKLNILVVDDEPINIELVAELLQNDYNVSVANSGIRGLDIFAQKRIDIILLDINMPDMNGFEVAKQIYSKEQNKEIPIIFFSADNSIDYMEKGLQAGAVDYITKPIEPRAFKLKIAFWAKLVYKTLESKHKQQLLDQYKNTVDRSAIVSKTDKEGIITFVNDKFCEISEYSREELIGKPHSIVRHKDMPSSAFKELWDTIQANKPWFGRVKNRKKSGDEYFVDTVINPIIDELGEVIEYIGVRHDITELEHYKNDLQEQLNIAVKEIIDTQKEVVLTMGAIGETRSKETGLHVKRVAEYSYLLAKLSGLGEDEANLIRQASPMHDIGKVGIQDSVLNKPGKLTENEFEVMKTHTQMGYEMLKYSQREILKTAATISYTHHEKYDGSGYPNKLKGEDIPIEGRITAVADVFDALGHDRCYKKAWGLDAILELFKEEKGKHFDPKLVDIFFENIDDFLKIRNNMEDII